jgi:DNA-binding protein HU-beta
MNTSDIADKIASEHGITKTASKAIVDSILKDITGAAAAGTEVSLAGFGKFKVAAKPARTARNPRTGESIEVPATKKISFSPAKTLKDAINA